MKREKAPSDIRIGVVVSRFNEPWPERMLGEAFRCFQEQGVSKENITVAYVPGAFEIPFAAKKMAQSKQFDVILCIGVIIRGETFHFEVIAEACAHGIVEVALSTGVPTIFSVLTTENEDQTEARVSKGYEGALAALEMATVLCV